MKKIILVIFTLLFSFNFCNAAYQEAYFVYGNDASDALEIYNSIGAISYMRSCLQNYSPNFEKGYAYCVCTCNDKNAISIIKRIDKILSKHPEWKNKSVNFKFGSSTTTGVVSPTACYILINATRHCLNK